MLDIKAFGRTPKLACGVTLAAYLSRMAPFTEIFVDVDVLYS
jgi:hypothetical protein